ncbi:MAG: DUF5753 domain-containing protein [Actinomycetota bacterium]|nr:DUF5753 domain-containing protein [Actinomycetota bacterium]
MSKARQTFERRQLGLTLTAGAPSRPTFWRGCSTSTVSPATSGRPSSNSARGEGATEINCYESGIIPGLLQSLGYVRATIDDGDGVWWEPSNAEREERIAVRLDRQEKTFGSAEPKTLRFLGFGDKGSPVGFSTVVFGPSTYFDEEPDTEALLRGFRRVQELALEPDDSVRLIRQIGKEA